MPQSHEDVGCSRSSSSRTGLTELLDRLANLREFIGTQCQIAGHCVFQRLVAVPRPYQGMRHAGLLRDGYLDTLACTAELAARAMLV